MEAYIYRMTGEVMTYKDQQRQRVCSTKCEVNLAAVYLVIHCQVQHYVGQRYLEDPHGINPDLPGLLPQSGKRGGVLRRRMSGEVIESYQPPGPLLSLPRAGHSSGTGGG